MKVFFSGVAGTGMSSLAGLFREMGYEVYGSDTTFYPPSGSILKKMGIRLFEGFSKENIPEDIDFCVIGNIISRGNPEAEHILNNKIRYFSMAEALNKFFIRTKTSVVVAGTHGKTTISSFLAYLFKKCDLDPGYFIGGKPVDLPSSYSTGGGEYFISEGDEYETSFFDRSSKFLKYFPDILILTSLEYDHLDFFKTENEYINAFKNIVNQVPSNGIIIADFDYKMNRQVLEKSFTPVLSYGSSDSDIRIEDVVPESSGFSFQLNRKGEKMRFKTRLPGKFNIHNFTAGIIAGLHLGMPVQAIKDAVETFKGVERRMKLIGEADNTIFYEDFAHHPTSIKGVLTSLKELYPGKNLTALFEPGSWSLKNRYFEAGLIESLSVSDEVRIRIPERIEKISAKERIDIEKIKRSLNKIGTSAYSHENIEEFEKFIEELDTDEERVVVILSNGRFGSLPDKIQDMFNRKTCRHPIFYK